MSVLLGAMLGTGLLLVLGPLTAPHRAAVPQRGARGGRIADRLARAGFTRIAPGLFVAASAVLGLTAGAIALAVTTLPAAGVLGAGAAGLAPWVFAGWLARSRSRLARTVWPEVVDHLISAVRSGQPLPDAIAALATTGPAPVRDGFARFAERWHATGTAEAGIDAAKEHFADPVADRLLEILRMARQVGGTELPAVLRDLAGALRHDLALRLEVEARQSWTTNAGKLGLAAPWIVLLLFATRPQAAAAYATPGGTLLIAAAAVVTLAAYRVMLAIGRLPEERRWR